MFFFDLRVQDFLDILIVAFLIYKVLMLLVGTRAMQLLRGLLIIGFIGATANLLDLRSLSWIIGKVLGAFIIIVPVLFQPELRHMLEELGKGRLLRIESGEDEIDPSAEQLVKGLLFCRRNKLGALCVLQRETSLKEICRTGVTIRAQISEELIGSLFYDKNPLHDGAVIIDQSGIIAAACILPLTDKIDIARRFGTRHRAAVGITEQSDAIALTVSEERQEITASVSGQLSDPLDEAQLRKICAHYFNYEGREENFMERLREEIRQQWSGGERDVRQ